jgi:hypothetical protein
MDSMTRMMLSLAVTISLLVGPTLAAADTTVVDDPNDSFGFIDIKSASASHGQGERLKHSIETYRRWRSRKLGDCASLAFVFPDTERYLQILFKSGQLRARMWRRTDKGNQRLVGHPEVWRDGRRRVIVSFRPSRLGNVTDEYRWRAVAGSPHRRCPPPGTTDYGISFDRAPEPHNAVHHL